MHFYLYLDILNPTPFFSHGKNLSVQSPYLLKRLTLLRNHRYEQREVQNVDHVRGIQGMMNTPAYLVHSTVYNLSHVCFSAVFFDSSSIL